MKRIVRGIKGLIFAVSTIIVIIVTAMQIAIYSDYGFYKDEYEKYNVMGNTGIQIDGVMDVTYEMMDFLIDKREDLEVIAKVHGEDVQFFSEDEKIHMQDVKNIFLVVLVMRNVAMIIAIAIAITYIYEVIKKKANIWKLLGEVAKYQLVVFGVLVVVCGAIAVYAVADFYSAFVLMHELLFTNDLWLMDPSTSLLINMLPQGFFEDMALRILIYIGGAVILMMITNVVLVIKSKNVQIVDK